MLCRNTVAVMTEVPDKRAEWRAQVAAFQSDMSGRGEDYAIEAAFAAALLDVLDGKPAALPPDNPYAHPLGQVLAAIAAQGGSDRADAP